MEFIEVLQSYSVPVVAGICLCVGYIIKHSLDFIPNKLIPLIMGVLGLGINIVINLSGITAEVVLAGLFSGLASTGLHNAFKNLIDKDGEG
jgi:hypothetical protein